MAPDVGFEPTTKRLTAAYSTAELIRIKSQNYILIFYKSQDKIKKMYLFFVDLNKRGIKSKFWWLVLSSSYCTTQKA